MNASMLHWDGTNTAPRKGRRHRMHGVIPSRRKGEEFMMSAHGCLASGSVAALVRQETVVLTPVLSRLVKATMAVAMALCLAQPASAQSPKVAFAIPYSGT